MKHTAQSIFKIKTFGNSMFPILQSEDVLTVKKIPTGKLKINDFVTFFREKKYITHRIIYIGKKGNSVFFVTKGDNTVIPDKPINAKDILGKVVGVKRGEKEVTIDNLYFIQSSFYFTEINKINSLFQKNDISFVFLKGLPLHLYYEHDYPKRTYADCDILIDRSKVELVCSLMQKLGYTRSVDSLSLIHDKLKVDPVEIQFEKIRHGFPVYFDIHLEAVFLTTKIGSLNHLYSQKLLHSYTTHLLSHKRMIKISPFFFPILRKEDLIIYLALHLFHHNFSGYHRFHFLSLIIRKSKVNYLYLARVITHYQLENFVFPIFLLLKKYYAITFPMTFLKQIFPSDKKRLFINTYLGTVDIFTDNDRISSGIARFYLIFQLSPKPFIEKLLVFISIPVLYSIMFALFKKGALLFNKNVLFYQKFNKFF